MKGVSPLVGFVLIIAISVSAITIAMNIGMPAIERSKEIILYEEGKDNLKIIDAAINQVLQEGDGSARIVRLKGTGDYFVNGNNVEFVMETKQGIIAPDIEKEEDGLLIKTVGNQITVYLEYDFTLSIDQNQLTDKTYIRNDDGVIMFNVPMSEDKDEEDLIPINEDLIIEESIDDSLVIIEDVIEPPMKNPVEPTSERLL